MSSTSHSSTCVVDTSFNDAVDELFQHTLTAHMLIGTFRFAINKKFHDEFLKNMKFQHFAQPLVEGILQWCNWRAVPAHPDSNLCYSSYYIYSCETYLSGKKLLSIVLHDLLRGPSMMLLTSCSSIPGLLICLVAPSDFQSTQYFMSEYSALITMTFWKTWFFIISHSLLRKGFFSDAVDKQLQLTLIQMFVFPQSYLKLWNSLIWK